MPTLDRPVFSSRVRFPSSPLTQLIPFSSSFSIDLLLCPTLPGLLVRLHFASMFSVVRFRTLRALRLSDLYIIWFVVVCELTTHPRFRFPSLSVPPNSHLRPLDVDSEPPCRSISKIRRLSPSFTTYYLISTPFQRRLSSLNHLSSRGLSFIGLANPFPLIPLDSDPPYVCSRETFNPRFNSAFPDESPTQMRQISLTWAH